jgi:hypothetical protein
MYPTDKTEMGIRFGCGFVLGLFLFGLSSIWFVYEDRGIYVATVFFASFAFGLAALRFGDAFWRWFARWFSWFS